MMLVLSRKVGEAIVINDNIEVFIVQVKGEKVRLGIVAPKEIPVHRKEVHQVIFDDNHSDIEERGVGRMLSEMEHARREMEQYKSMLLGCLLEEWSSVTQADVDQAMINTMDTLDSIPDLKELNHSIFPNHKDLPSHYQIGLLLTAKSQLHELCSKSKAVGLELQMALQQQLVTILRALLFVPLEWSKLSHKSQGDLMVCAGLHSGISIVYGVDESRRIVIVKSLRVDKGHALFR